MMNTSTSSSSQQQQQQDAVIAVESTSEWNVHDILYDGQERYLAPLTFTDYVAKYARKIDWRKLVGSETSADVYNDEDEDDNEESDQHQDDRGDHDDHHDQQIRAAESGGVAGQQQQMKSDGSSSEKEKSSKSANKADRGGGEVATSAAGNGSGQQPGVGPWDSVAKRLLQSLTEMNVLLDAIQVARNGKYLALDAVQQDAPDQAKYAVLAAKKKALTSASAVLLSLADQLRGGGGGTAPKSSSSSMMIMTPTGFLLSPPPSSGSGSGGSGGSQQQQQQQQQQLLLDSELEELIEMRKKWRLKKVGNTILGDLSHHMPGSGGGYRPNATFEAKKTAEKTSGGGGGFGIGGKRAAWQVTLPKDLEENLCIRVAIIEPAATMDGGGKNVEIQKAQYPPPLFSNKDKMATKKKQQKQKNVGGRVELVEDEDDQDEDDWRMKLRTAQRTLFWRDLFAQLAREAAHVPDLCCAINGRSIITRLPGGRILRVSLEPPQIISCGSDQNQKPPQEQDESESESAAERERERERGDGFVLEHNLDQLFDGELEGAREVMIPRPVTAPLTHLTKKARLAGPDAASSASLTSQDASEKLLIQRLLDQACHALLYQKCKEVIDEFASSCHDPTVTVHWCPETTGVWSMLTIQMTTPFYEFCGKTVMMLEIGTRDVRATMKDGEVISVSTNLHELGHFVKLRARQHIISAVGTLCRPHQWQTLYSNPSHLDEDGELSPAILIGHPAGSRAVFLKYPLSAGQPVIAVQYSSSSSSSTGPPPDAAGLVEQGQGQGRDKGHHHHNHLRLHLRNQLRDCNYDQLPGAKFLQKIELLIATLT